MTVSSYGSNQLTLDSGGGVATAEPNIRVSDEDLEAPNGVLPLTVEFENTEGSYSTISLSSKIVKFILQSSSEINANVDITRIDHSDGCIDIQIKQNNTSLEQALVGLCLTVVSTAVAAGSSFMALEASKNRDLDRQLRENPEADPAELFANSDTMTARLVFNTVGDLSGQTTNVIVSAYQGEIDMLKVYLDRLQEFNGTLESFKSDISRLQNFLF